MYVTDQNICVCYRPEHNAKGSPMELNFEGLEMQDWNIPTDRAQRLAEKNGVICLVIMFTSRVLVIKNVKNGPFFMFSADDSKKSVTLWAKYLSVPERSYCVLSENDMVNRLWGYRSWDNEGRIIERTAESANITEILW